MHIIDHQVGVQEKCVNISKLNYKYITITHTSISHICQLLKQLCIDFPVHDMCIGHDEALNYDSQVHFWGLKVCIQTCILMAIRGGLWILSCHLNSQKVSRPTSYKSSCVLPTSLHTAWPPRAWLPATNTPNYMHKWDRERAKEHVGSLRKT